MEGPLQTPWAGVLRLVRAVRVLHPDEHLPGHHQRHVLARQDGDRRAEERRRDQRVRDARLQQPRGQHEPARPRGRPRERPPHVARRQRRHQLRGAQASCAFLHLTFLLFKF